MTRILKVVLLAGLFRWAGVAYGADITQPVDPRKSSIEFVVNSSWLNFSGEIKKYSGGIELRGADLSLQSLEFELDLSGVSVNASPEASLQLSNILASLPNSAGRFKSKRITRQRGGGYYIEGTFTQGQTTRPCKFSLPRMRISRKESIIELNEQGSASQLDQNVRPPFVPPDAKGRLRAKLVFVAPAGRRAKEQAIDSAQSSAKAEHPSVRVR